MHYKLSLFWGIFLFVSSCFAQVNMNDHASVEIIATQVFCYTNPVTKETMDHYIIQVGKQWYCTGTSLHDL